jgi:hypothetical protein
MAPPLKLSKPTKLKDLFFWCEGFHVWRITMALQTVQSKHLQQISIRLSITSANPAEETVHGEWLDLDRLLVRFWTSHSIRPKIKYSVKGGDNPRAFVLSSLPELTSRGLIDLVED